MPCISGTGPAPHPFFGQSAVVSGSRGDHCVRDSAFCSTWNPGQSRRCPFRRNLFCSTRSSRSSTWNHRAPRRMAMRDSVSGSEDVRAGQHSHGPGYPPPRFSITEASPVDIHSGRQETATHGETLSPEGRWSVPRGTPDSATAPHADPRSQRTSTHRGAFIRPPGRSLDPLRDGRHRARVPRHIRRPPRRAGKPPLGGHTGQFSARVANRAPIAGAVEHSPRRRR